MDEPKMAQSGGWEGIGLAEKPSNPALYLLGPRALAACPQQEALLWSGTPPSTESASMGHQWPRILTPTLAVSRGPTHCPGRPRAYPGRSPGAGLSSVLETMYSDLPSTVRV